MKITATYSRKLGLPGYSSCGGSCTVEIDAKSADPVKVAETIRVAYALATSGVEEFLSERLRELGPDPADRTDAPTEPEAEPEAEPESEPERRRPLTYRSSRPRAAEGEPDHDPDWPIGGRQRLAMGRRLEDTEGSGVTSRTLSDWGRRRQLPWKICDWAQADVEEAAAYLLSLRRDRATDRRQPLPNGRGNGKAVTW